MAKEPDGFVDHATRGWRPNPIADAAENFLKGAEVLRGGRVGLHIDRQRISGSSAGCFLELPIWGVTQEGRSPTGVMPHIDGQCHAAIATGRLSKYVWSGVLAAKLECGLRLL